LSDLRPEERLGWVCGLGHGVLKTTPQKNVKEFVTRIREAF
jgi:uroporphyrinogen decarboxylase